MQQILRDPCVRRADKQPAVSVTSGAPALTDKAFSLVPLPESPMSEGSEKPNRQGDILTVCRGSQTT